MDIKIKMTRYMLLKGKLIITEGYGLIQHDCFGYFYNPKAYWGAKTNTWMKSSGEEFKLYGVEWSDTSIQTENIRLENRYSKIYIVGERNDLEGIKLLISRVKVKAKYDLRYKRHLEYLTNLLNENA